MALIELESHRLFGGLQKRFQHGSSILQCNMTFSVYVPSHHQEQELPVLYWLSGLTCNDENFSMKSGAQRYAAELGIILVIPDTGPRGKDVMDDPSYDLGQGASFYVNAIQEPWVVHYQMFEYLTSELPALIRDHFPISGKQSIAGHSMGGHGALMLALKQPDLFCSVSAFAPIVNPAEVPWGQKAFTAYLGTEQAQWFAYDSCYLMEHYQGKGFPLLIDQGTGDPFLSKELQPEKLAVIAKKRDWPMTLRWQEGYDHSYYFIASFIRDHLLFHYEYLK